MKNIFNWILLLLSVMLIILLINNYLSIPNYNQNWFGVGAGFLAILAIISISKEYFFPPKSGDGIKAPDRIPKVISGMIGILSGILWIISALPIWYK